MFLKSSTDLFLMISKNIEIPGLWSQLLDAAQPAITCSKLIIETLEQGVKYVQS